MVNITKTALKLENTTFKGNINSSSLININESSNIEIKNIKILSNNITNASITITNTKNIKITHSLFRNNKATENTAGLYLKNTNMNIQSTIFENNMANKTPAVYVESSNLTIKSCIFRNNTALNDAGGAISSTNTNLTINNTNFTKNRAINGGAIVVVNGTTDEARTIIKQISNTIISNSNFNENMAKYMAGCIYDEYSNMEIINTNFTKNHALNGGVLYADKIKLLIKDTQLINNTAENMAGCIYAYETNITQKNTRYIQSSAKVAIDMYIPFNVNFKDTNNTYTNKNSIERKYIQQQTIPDNNHYTYNTTILPGELPSYYNLADHGLITPTKNQVDNGNCWAFATIGILESNILKTTGKEYDLSENNIKNLMSVYSKNGQYMPPNGGGNEVTMGIGYIINWLGPVLESSDVYNPYNFISTQLPSIMKVSNVYAITERKNATDNNEIKQAILKYGALDCDIYVDESHLINHNFYVNNTTSTNHGIMIIGWNDTYSRYNFKDTPAGDGAFIIKNSWGVQQGEDEFYYISYYDASLKTASIDDVSSPLITFILDNNNFDKQYLYDISGIFGFQASNSTNITYSNEYEIQQNEQICAFGTYIYNPTAKTDYTAQIYVMENLKLHRKEHLQKTTTIKL